MDWIQFLTDHNIHYVTSGPNTKRGEVSVKCPWCGDGDPSEHLGINLQHEAWGCHRNQAHRGKSSTWLISALLGCSNSQAKLIVEQYDKADPETLEQAIVALEGKNEAPVKPAGALKLPLEARMIGPKGRFADYIRSRGFDDPNAVAYTYNLRAASTGQWKDRIIIPIYDEDEKLVAWTARAIMRPVSAPRYLTTEGNAIKTVIGNLQYLLKPKKVLFVTEGPMDAIKMDYYSYPHCSATCVFGTSITPAQISLLKKVSRRFEKTVIMLDKDAVESTFGLADWLPKAIIGYLPEGVKDPGDLSKEQVKTIAKQYLK